MTRDTLRTAFSIAAASAIESPFSGPWFVLAIAGTRQLVVTIKAMGKVELIPYAERDLTGNLQHRRHVCP